MILLLFLLVGMLPVPAPPHIDSVALGSDAVRGGRVVHPILGRERLDVDATIDPARRSRQTPGPTIVRSDTSRSS